MMGVIHQEDMAKSVASEYVRGQNSKGAQDPFSPKKGKLTLASNLLAFSSLSKV